MANTPIYVRSPRIIELTGTANQDTSVELFIWNDPASIPSTATKTLNKPIPSNFTTSVQYDISPYCREYIEHTSYTEITSLTAAPVTEYCYCTVKTYIDAVLQDTFTYICFDGYGYYEDGYNPTLITSFLTEGTYYVEKGVNSGGIYYHNDLTVPWGARYTGLQSGGVTTVTLTHEIGYFPYIHSNYAGEGNLIEVFKDNVLHATYYFIEQEECKYDTYKCDFVNRFGNWQRIVFFKASVDDFEVTNTEFNAMSEDVDYTTTEARKQVFNVNGKQKITVNTGFVGENYKNAIKELMLSETILLNDKPVVLNTKQTKLQKNINDRNINYQMQFEYAYDTINYIV